MKKLLLLLALVVTQVVFAQYTNFYDEGRIGSQVVNAFCQDADGFLWMATRNGLRRFDGSQFVAYYHSGQDSASLADNEVHSLLVDRNHDLWVGTANGLQRYLPEGDDFCQVSFHHIPTEGRIWDIIQLHDGTVLCAVANEGVFRVDSHAMQGYPMLVESKVFTPRNVCVLFEDSHGRLWIGTDREGVVRVDLATQAERLYQLGASRIRNIVEDADGRILVVTSQAIFRWEEQDDRFYRFPYVGKKGNVQYRSALLTAGGEVIVGTYGQGFVCVKQGSEEVVDTDGFGCVAIDVDKAKVNALFEDRYQNVWAGCQYQGVLLRQQRPMPFAFWKSPAASGNPGWINVLYCDKQGDVWCAVESNGIYQLDAYGKQLRHIPMSETVFSMFEDSNGTFWMGVDGRGLYSFDKKTGRLKLVYAMEEDFTSIRCITEDSHRRLYAAVMGKGCLCYDLQTGKSRLFTYEEGGRGMANAWVTSVFCDSQDRIWFGHFGGVSCYDIRNGCFLELPFSPEIKSGSFYAFAEGEDGSIWMATRNGLLCYDVTRNQYSVMMTGQGLLDDVICGLVKDGHGDLWCSTMRGISRIDGHTKEVVNYYAGDDWQGNVYLEGRYTQATDGSIYFGSGKGIVCFHPDSIRKVRMERTPVITGMQVNGRLVNRQTLSGKHPVVSEDLVRATRVHLSYSDNSFAFWVSMMDYRNAESIFYEYRLEEFGDTWSRTLPGESRIQYHHLPPGDYTLLLRACENGFCSPVRAMKVHIAPPWYFSPFARILYTLFIIGACCLWYIAVQRKRREEVGEMKLRFFINIAHEIRSPLTLIVSPVEDLLKKASDAEMHKSLLLIRYNANRILGLLNQLLDVRRIDKGQMRLHFAEIDIRHFVNELLDAFSGQARQQGITLQVEFADDLPLVWVDPDNFDKVLVNLLMNALKYTPQQGTVCVSVKTGSAPDAAGPLRDYLEIAVEDTGKGLNERELKKIFERFYQSESGRVSARQGFGIGLNLCQALVKLHYGVIFAENRKDVQGSRFVVRLPLGNKHLKKEEMADGKPEEHLSLHERVEEPAYFPVQEKGKRNPTHYRVLVIDDDEALRNFLQESLSVHYRVDVAADGMEGWQKALATLPDVVVSDVMMPEMDGFQLLKELKKNPNTNHIPVVLLTSKTELASRMEGLEQGADGYLNKPFSQDELDVLIANLISNRLRLKGKYSGSQEQEGKVKPLKVKNTDEILMERVMTVIDQNLGNPMLSVELLAKEVGMSRTQLHRRMKDITGLAVSDFIRNIRLRQAARLLKEKRLMITQVAYAVGFSSQTHFSTMFRRQYGMTPTEYAETGEKASEDTEVTGTGTKHPDEA